MYFLLLNNPAHPSLSRADQACEQSPGESPALSVLLLVVSRGARERVQEEGGPPKAAEGQQVGAQCIQQVAPEEAGPGVIRHTVGEGRTQVHGGTHVRELCLGATQGEWMSGAWREQVPPTSHPREGAQRIPVPFSLADDLSPLSSPSVCLQMSLPLHLLPVLLHLSVSLSPAV